MVIEFENKKYLKLKRVDNEEFSDIVNGIVPQSERILETFKAGRDGVVFTDKRLIAINVQGITGKQKTITTIPYSKISAFAVDTPAVIDIDSSLTVWVGGLGQFTFEFSAKADVGAICRCINGCD